jgi:hypothetical protein
MQKIYLVGYEGNNVLSTSGWWWFKGKKDAEEQFEEVKADLEPEGTFVYKGEIEVQANLSDEEIDDLVEKFLS